MGWELDKTHSEIGFAVKHMMISTVRGKFTDFDGRFTLDPSDLSKSSAIGTVRVASISTGEAQRDGHLLSPDFFAAEQFPEMRFETTKVVRDGSHVTVTGHLTIRDVTKEATFKGTVEGPAKDPWGNMRVGFSLAGEIQREDFGLTWNQMLEAGGVLVGKAVKIEIEAQAVQK